MTDAMTDDIDEFQIRQIKRLLKETTRKEFFSTRNLFSIFFKGLARQHKLS